MREVDLPARMHHPINYSRPKPDDEMMEELFLVAADAVKRMPKLRAVMVCIGDVLGSIGSRGWGDLWWNTSACARLVYEPSDEVAERWKDAIGPCPGGISVRVVNARKG